MVFAPDDDVLHQIAPFGVGLGEEPQDVVLGAWEVLDVVAVITRHVLGQLLDRQPLAVVVIGELGLEVPPLAFAPLHEVRHIEWGLIDEQRIGNDEAFDVDDQQVGFALGMFGEAVHVIDGGIAFTAAACSQHCHGDSNKEKARAEHRTEPRIGPSPTNRRAWWRPTVCHWQAGTGGAGREDAGV